MALPTTPLFVKTHDFLLWLIRHTQRFPKNLRHSYTLKLVHDPKRRKISAAPFRDRVVHHAVVAALEPIYERGFVFDSYACRRRKGTHRAWDRAQGFLRRYPYRRNRCAARSRRVYRGGVSPST